LLLELHLTLVAMVVLVIAVLDIGHRRNNGTFCRSRFN